MFTADTPSIRARYRDVCMVVVRAQRVEVAERRRVDGGGAGGHLVVAQRFAAAVRGAGSPPPITVVKIADSVLISRMKSCAANRPSPSCSGRVFDVAAIDTPRSTSCDSIRDTSVVLPGSSSSNSSMSTHA